MKILILLFVIFTSTRAWSVCIQKNDEDQLSEFSKVAKTDCSFMKASYGDFLKNESPNVSKKLNSKVKELIDTKAELLIGNVSKLDSLMALEATTLPQNKYCKLEHLNNLINCPNAEQRFKDKGFKSRRDFLDSFSQKFSKQQDLELDSGSCMSKDALNYLMSKHALKSIKDFDRITNELTLKEFKDANTKILSMNPLLRAALLNFELFNTFKKQLTTNNSNYDPALASLMKNEKFQKIVSEELDNECTKSFKEIASMICKEIYLPNEDAQQFIEIYERKNKPNSLFNKGDNITLESNIYIGVSCLEDKSLEKLSILPLIEDLASNFPRKEDINVQTLEKSFAEDEKQIKDPLCLFKKMNCNTDQCSLILDKDTNNCSERSSKISFSDIFNNLCLSEKALCTRENICNNNSPLFELNEYESRLKNIIATIATTTTTKDATTGKETTTTTYETVRRVSNFAKSFHGDSKPAGTTLAIPAPKENVSIHVETTSGKDITREVAPEIAARQAERAPQPARQVFEAPSVQDYRQNVGDTRAAEKSKWTPSFEPTATTPARIDNEEMSGYRQIIDDLRKTKDQLAQAKTTDEKRRLQDTIDGLEREKNLAQAQPGQTARRRLNNDEEAGVNPPTRNQVPANNNRTYANSPTATNPNTEEANNDTQSPVPAASNVRPATPVATKTAANSTSSSKKTGTATAEQGTTANTAGIDAAANDLKVFKEIPITSQSEIKLSELLAKESEILAGGKAFSIYEIINGKKELIKFEPVKEGKAIRFRPIATNENKNLIKKLKSDRLLISTNLNDILKSI